MPFRVEQYLPAGCSGRFAATGTTAILRAPGLMTLLWVFTALSTVFSWTDYAPDSSKVVFIDLSSHPPYGLTVR